MIKGIDPMKRTGSGEGGVVSASLRGFYPSGYFTVFASLHLLVLYCFLIKGL